MSLSQLTKHRAKNVRKLFKAPQNSMRSAIWLGVLVFGLFFKLDSSLLLVPSFIGIVFAEEAVKYFKNHKSKFLTPINPHSQRTPRGAFYVLTFWNSLIYLFLIILLIKIFSTSYRNPMTLPISLVLQFPVSIAALVFIVRHVRWYWLWKAMEVRMAAIGLRRTTPLQFDPHRSSD